MKKKAEKKIKKVATIYHDPLTRLKPEGSATLVRFEFEMLDNCEYWTVRFVGDRYDEVCERIVNKQDIAQW